MKKQQNKKINKIYILNYKNVNSNLIIQIKFIN